MKRQSILVLAIGTVVMLASNACADMYTITDLYTLPGAIISGGSDINNNGQVVGWCTFPDGSERSYLWQNGSMTDLGALPGRSKSRAYAINDHGQAVGESYEAGDSDQHAILFDSTGAGQNIDLGTLGGPKSVALDINNQGQIVGKAKQAGHSAFFAASFDPTGNQNNIAIGPPGSDAQAINNQGVAVGGALMTGGYHTMILDMTGGTDYVDLGTLGGLDNGARTISDMGLIAGEAQAPSEPIIAALFNSTGIVTLGTLGGQESMATASNSWGQVVGWAYTASGERHATLFDTTGNFNNIDLNTLIDPALGWTLIGAYGINDNGWIVGYGTNPEGYQHAYLLTPIPSAVVLGTIGITFSGWLLRRRKML